MSVFDLTMPNRSHALPLRFAALLLGAALPAVPLTSFAAPAPASPASAATAMTPFRVEAEFGVDGLRIQPSQAVLNAYQLEQHGVAQFQDITGIAPNLFLTNSDSRGLGDVLALRGVTNSLFFSAPGVALYVDDVPGGSVASYPSSLLHIDSVSVRAGPQSTEVGRNAPGGLIDIKTRVPSGAHQGRLQAEYGSYNLTAVQAAFDGPLSGNAGYSLAVGYSDREGYIDNTFLRRTADDRRSLSGRAALHFKPTSDLTLRLSLLAEKFDDGTQRLSSLFSPDPFVTQSGLAGETQIERNQLSFQARQKFSWATLVATSARQEFDINPAVTDIDFSPLSLGSSVVLQNEETWSQEFRFESLPVTSSKAAWRAGLFLSATDTDGDATREFAVPPMPPFVPPGFVQNERTTFETEQKNIAAFAGLDHPLTNELLLKVGARFEHVDSEIDRSKISRNNFGFPSPQDPRYLGAQEDDYVSATAGLVYSVNPALNLHARTSLAHKPEGFSGFTATPALASFESEEQWASEIGLTFGPPRGRFGGSLVAFWNHIDGYQFERSVPGATDFVVVNAREARARGVEAKFMFSPVERLWWDFHAGYTDAEFTNHRDNTGLSVSGRHVPFVPRFTVRTGVTVELGAGFTANASYAATGRTYYDERNTAMWSQPSYGIVNAQLRYRFNRTTVTVYGQNLADKLHYTFINPEIAAGTPGAPRRFGVQLAYEF